MYIIRRMHVRAGALLAAVWAMGVAAGCGGPLGRQYEYEEQLYLTTKGAASVIVDASIPALVALRGVPLDPSPSAKPDQEQITRALAAMGCAGARVGQPWRRFNRWFVNVRLETDDARTLSTCGLLGWSSYAFERDVAGLHYTQKVGAPAGGNPGAVKWDGRELVAFRLHLPSRIQYHNVRRLDVDEPGSTDRGNILTWEQHLPDRRAGKPVIMDVRLEAESILHRTLWLFAGAFLAAMAVLGTIVWLTVRRGRKRVVLSSQT
jgi:hypothetical protein